MKNLRFFYHGVLTVLLLWVGLASSHAQNSWAFEQVSPPIYRLDQAVEQRFSLKGVAAPPSDHAKITAVHVQVSSSMAVRMQSYLCVDGMDQCLPIQAGRLYTKAFNEYLAQSQFYVVHRVRNWEGSYPPAFIKTQLSIWWQ